jgi:hypothetical protein
MSEGREGQWWGGITEEWFNNGPFDTREEIIAEMRGVYPESKPFYIGVQGTYTPFTRDYVEEMLELEALDVDDECGPSASDNWPPRIGKEERDEANAKIKSILADLCGDCSVFPIENSEKIEPTV